MASMRIYRPIHSRASSANSADPAIAARATADRTAAAAHSVHGSNPLSPALDAFGSVSLVDFEKLKVQGCALVASALACSSGLAQQVAVFCKGSLGLGKVLLGTREPLHRRVSPGREREQRRDDERDGKREGFTGHVPFSQGAA